MIHKRSKGLRTKASLRQQVSRCYFHEWEAVLTVFGLGRAFFFPMENIRLLLPGAFESPSLSLPLFRLQPVSLTFGRESSGVPPLSSCGMYISLTARGKPCPDLTQIVDSFGDSVSGFEHHLPLPVFFFFLPLPVPFDSSRAGVMSLYWQLRHLKQWRWVRAQWASS